MQLEQTKLVCTVEKTEPRLLNARRGRTGRRNSPELVSISSEAARRIVEDIEDAWVGKAAVGRRFIQRRAKRTAALRQLFGNAQTKPDRGRNNDAERAGCRGRKTLLLEAVSGRNNRPGGGGCHGREGGVGKERDDRQGRGRRVHGGAVAKPTVPMPDTCRTGGSPPMRQVIGSIMAPAPNRRQRRLPATAGASRSRSVSRPRQRP